MQKSQQSSNLVYSNFEYKRELTTSKQGDDRLPLSTSPRDSSPKLSISLSSQASLSISLLCTMLSLGSPIKTQFPLLTLSIQTKIRGTNLLFLLLAHLSWRIQRVLMKNHLHLIPHVSHGATKKKLSFLFHSHNSSNKQPKECERNQIPEIDKGTHEPSSSKKQWRSSRPPSSLMTAVSLAKRKTKDSP